MSLLDYFDFEFVDAVLKQGATDGSYDDEGDWVSGTPIAPIAIRIVEPQPLTGKELQMFPSGEHTRNYLRTYIITDINTRSLYADSDTIEYLNKEFKVMLVEERLGDDFYKLYIYEITDDNQ